MRKLLITPVVALVLGAAPANAQDVGSILRSVIGGGSPSYGYQQSYQPVYVEQQSYAYPQSYGYQPAYGYQQSYGYQQTYGYQPRYVYSRPRYVSYGYRAPLTYRYPRYRYAAYRHHARRHHYRSYAYRASYRRYYR